MVTLETPPLGGGGGGGTSSSGGRSSGGSSLKETLDTVQKIQSGDMATTMWLDSGMTARKQAIAQNIAYGGGWDNYML